MSSIFIEVGQAGCQIGDKLNKRISNNYYCTRIHAPNKVHAIMVDTEPKVLKPFIDCPPRWLDPDNVRYFQHGRGNNWSYGYIHHLPSSQTQTTMDFMQGHKQFSHLPAKGEQGEDESLQLTDFEQKVLVEKYIKENKEICGYTLERVRRELESTDCPMAINMLCSLGGGTGSGLGTKIVEKIREQFSMDIFAHVVLPNKSGETPLQIYNCALSLASLQEHTSAICPIENDKMIAMFLQEEGDTPVAKNDLGTINSEIANIQARLFAINENPHSDQFYNSLINNCVVSPLEKYVTIYGASAPASSPAPFDACFGELCNQLRINNEDGLMFEEIQNRREKCLENCLVVLNPEKNVQSMQEHHRKKLRNIINPVQFNPTIKCEEIYNPFRGAKKQQTEKGAQKGTEKGIEKGAQKGKKEQKQQILFLMNHSNILRYLEYISVSGRKKFEARAYLWHYKYADLPGAFQSLDSVIDQYLYSAHSSSPM